MIGVLGHNRHVKKNDQATAGSNTLVLAYDDNGNYAFGTGTPTVVWSSYINPTDITNGSDSYEFDYGPDRSRYRKVHNLQTTHYLGTRFERSFGAGVETHRHAIQANGRTILIREDVSTTVTHRYVHRDHIGSITAITDESTGAVVERLSYDA